MQFLLTTPTVLLKCVSQKSMLLIWQTWEYFVRNNFEVLGKNCKTYRMSLLNNVQKSVKSFKITMVIKVSPLSQFSTGLSQQRQMIFINIIWNISSFLWWDILKFKSDSENDSPFCGNIWKTKHFIWPYGGSPPSYCIGIEIEITININFYVGHNILFYYGPLDAMWTQ